jgi:hypothetical protein
MDRARAIHELGEIGFICTFRSRTRGVDRVVEPAPTALVTSLEIITPGFAIVAIIPASITGLIFVVPSVVRAHSLLGLFCMNVVIGYTDELGDGARALAKQLYMKLFMAKSFGEGGNGFCIGDVRYGVSCF